MAVKVLVGDLFESEAQTLVNTVNCVGVMGKGIALEFKERFPDMYQDYVTRCERNEVKLGRPYLYKPMLLPWLLNFPTKDHWRSLANLDAIIQGLQYLQVKYKEWGIESLAVPPLGCGHGQLEWRVVGPTLYEYLSFLDIPVELYAPFGTSHEELQPEFLGQESPLATMPEDEWIKPAWVALIEILKRIEDQPYHWPVGRTIFQKIAYVATEEGLPTELDYEKRSYGPYSKQLKRSITRLMNNGLIEETRRGNRFEVLVGRTFDDARKDYQSDLVKWEPIIEKVADLFLRMSTTKQAELVATVLFSARLLYDAKQEPPEELDVYDAVLEWKQRRRPPIAATEVASTIRNLAALGWLQVEPSENLPLPQTADFEF